MLSYSHDPKAGNKDELDLAVSLEKLRTYRKGDSTFERTIADYVDAEASLKEDPAEGQKADVYSTAGP